MATEFQKLELTWIGKGKEPRILIEDPSKSFGDPKTENMLIHGDNLLALKAFSKNFEFINPTFSPKEKIIRGICYRHPGETEMYKYKWNRESIDTLEYISYEKNEQGEKTGKVVVATDKFYGKNFKVLKRLNSVPNEYKEIKGYDWFTGKGLRIKS
ncbi:MAG: hypothetical protein ABIW47_05955 [Ginsengibacter sp.]